MTYIWTVETLLGPIECEGDVVDFLTRVMSKADCKDLLLLGLYYRQKIGITAKSVHVEAARSSSIP